MPDPMHDSGGSEDPKRVTRNLAFSLCGLFVATPLNVIGMMVMARRLGKEAVGVCFSVFAMAMVTYILLDAGVATVLTRRVARDLKNARRHIGEAAGVCLLVGLAAFPMLMLCGLAWSTAKQIPMQGGLFLMAATAVAGRHAMEFSVGALRGLERFEFETVVRFVQNGSFCLLVLTLVTKQAGPAAAIGAFALSHLLAASVAGGVLLAGFGCRQFHLSRATVFSWLGESWPLGLGDAIRGLGWQIDTILLSLLGTNAAVGVYNVAFRPLMPLRVMPRALASATFPMMSRLQGDSQKLSQAFSRSVNALWFVSLPICIAITACARPLVVLLTTDAFIDAVLPLQIMIWITIPLFITTQHRYLFAAFGAQSVYSRLVTGTLVVKVTLLAALLPAFGVYGACAATVAAELLLLEMSVAACRRFGLVSLPWRRMSLALPPAAAMAAMVWIASSWSWPWLFAATAIAGLCYVGLCLLFGVFDRTELKHLAALLRRKGQPGGLLSPAADSTQQEPVAPATLD